MDGLCALKQSLAGSAAPSLCWEPAMGSGTGVPSPGDIRARGEHSHEGFGARGLMAVPGL